MLLFLLGKRDEGTALPHDGLPLRYPGDVCERVCVHAPSSGVYARECSWLLLMLLASTSSLSLLPKKCATNTDKGCLFLFLFFLWRERGPVRPVRVCVRVRVWKRRTAPASRPPSKGLFQRRRCAFAAFLQMSKRRRTTRGEWVGLSPRGNLARVLVTVWFVFCACPIFLRLSSHEKQKSRVRVAEQRLFWPG